MQIKKISKLLKKINNLHDNIKDENTTISSIEKDLLKNYVQGLYEAVISDDEVESKPKKTNEHVTKITPAGTKTPSPEVIVEEVVQVEKSPVLSKPVVEVVADLSEESVPVVEAPVVEVEIIPPVKEVVDELVAEVVSGSKRTERNVSEELATLFETIEVKELSSKLANSPIKSIKAKMGINDKLLTIKELFDKDNASFDKAIATLDAMSSFEEAKQYLADEFVDKYNWLSDKKFKKATRFVQLIQRRYL